MAGQASKGTWGQRAGQRAWGEGGGRSAPSLPSRGTHGHTPCRDLERALELRSRLGEEREDSERGADGGVVRRIYVLGKLCTRGKEEAVRW